MLTFSLFKKEKKGLISPALKGSGSQLQSIGVARTSQRNSIDVAASMHHSYYHIGDCWLQPLHRSLAASCRVSKVVEWVLCVSKGFMKTQLKYDLHASGFFSGVCNSASCMQLVRISFSFGNFL